MRKIQIFVFIFLSGCFPEGAGLKERLQQSLVFFSKASACKKAYKKISNKKNLSKKDRLFFSIQAELCIQRGENHKAEFILERLLRAETATDNSIKEIKTYEKKLADLSFVQNKNYERALKYYNRILTRPLNPGEKFFIQYRIAESFFYLKKHSQALIEIEKCFFRGISMKERKQALTLKARILMIQQQFDLALLLFEKQIELFPKEELFFREYRAFIYEYKKDLLLAIAELEKIKPSNVFIERKKARLRERQKNQPGVL